MDKQRFRKAIASGRCALLVVTGLGIGAANAAPELVAESGGAQSGENHDQKTEEGLDSIKATSDPETVAPVAPTISKSNECNAISTVVIPDGEGVIYRQETDGLSAIVWATPDAGYTFKEGSKTLWSFDLTPTELCPLCEEPLVSISLGVDGTYGLTADGKAWRYDWNGNWEAWGDPGQPFVSITERYSGVHGLTADGKAWRYRYRVGGSYTWEALGDPGQPLVSVTGGSDYIYGLTADGKAWWYGGGRIWELMGDPGQPLVSISADLYVPGRDIYGLTADGEAWSSNPFVSHWDDGWVKLPNPEPEDAVGCKVITVEPVAPTLNASEECDVEGTVTIPNIEGVIYSERRSGDYLVVEAEPEPGYVFPEGTQTTWAFNVAAEECPPTFRVEKRVIYQGPENPNLLPDDAMNHEFEFTYTVNGKTAVDENGNPVIVKVKPSIYDTDGNVTTDNSVEIQGVSVGDKITVKEETTSIPEVASQQCMWSAPYTFAFEGGLNTWDPTGTVGSNNDLVMRTTSTYQCDPVNVTLIKKWEDVEPEDDWTATVDWVFHTDKDDPTVGVLDSGTADIALLPNPGNPDADKHWQAIIGEGQDLYFPSGKVYLTLSEVNSPDIPGYTWKDPSWGVGPALGRNFSSDRTDGDHDR